MAENPDLSKERAKVSFDREKLTNLLDGGSSATARRRNITAGVIEDCREKNGPLFFFKSDSQKYDDSVRKSVYFRKKQRQLQLSTFDEDMWVRSLVFPNDTGAFFLHDGMFIPAIEQQATDAQKAEWQPKIERLEMIGTYAQTEMGHGTHLRGLETTATYDPTTQEFILNSPTRSSIKWWPGGMGKTANHVLLMAQLISRDTEYGIHLFLVPIRNIKTHQPLQGVSVGDIGPKIGFNSTDNGYLELKNVRIPRTNMLMKSAEVRPDGTYARKSESDKSSYGTMVLVRSTVTRLVSAACLAQAVTIAIRFSCVRRQSEIAPGEREPQILDYVTQQYKLFPALAEAYAFHFTGQEMLNIYYQYVAEMKTGDGSKLPELHALSSSLKAFTTASASLSIEQCRLACGGHGFSQASGFQKLYVYCTAAETYEGENTVLHLQTARYLLKSYERGQAGKPLRASVVYLTEPAPQGFHISDEISVKDMVKVVKYLAKRKVEAAALRSMSLMKDGFALHDVWNKIGIELVQASEAHARCFVMETFANVVERIDDQDLQRIMSKLCQLYGCCCIVNNASTLFEGKLVTRAGMDAIQGKLRGLLADIRPEAVHLVDAFDFDDHLLGSILGRYDGQVYENLYKWAKNSPLNKTDVHPSFEKYIMPLREELKNSKL